MKNLILLVVDSLPFDTLGLSGHSPSPSPTIDSIAQSGYCLENCYSVGSVTQFSYPGLFTSTYPLDYDGYDRGILDRPATLSEVLRDSGYRTAAFSSSWWLGRPFGYERGFDEFYTYFDISKTLQGIEDNYISYYRNYHDDDNIKQAVALQHLAPFLKRNLDRLAEICADREGTNSTLYATDTPLNCGWPYTELKASINTELNGLNSEPQNYIWKLVCQENPSIFATLQQRRSNQPNRPYQNMLLTIPSGIIYALKNSRNIYRSTPKPHKFLRRYQLEFRKKSRFKSKTNSPSASYLLDEMTQWISHHEGDQPFFCWTHLLDLHDLNFRFWEDRRTSIPDETLFLRHLRNIATTSSWEGNPYYDYSVRYVDKALQAFMESLLELNVLEDTCIAIVGDHGHYYPERPFRLNATIEDFYDERYHIPFILWNGPDEKQDSSLYSSIDIPPTILDSLAIDCPPSFQGRSTLDSEFEGREFVLMEDTGKGPCLLDERAINVAVRTREEKLVCRDSSPVQYFDLTHDPNEFDNRLGDSQPMEYDHLKSIVGKRLSAIGS